MKTTDAREIVTVGTQYRLYVFARRFRGRDISVAQAPIYLNKRLLRRLRVVMLQSRRDHRLRHFRLAETRKDFLFSRETEHSQERGDRKAPCAVIHGKSARKISCSFSSPVVLFLRRTTIESGASNVRMVRFA